MNPMTPQQTYYKLVVAGTVNAGKTTFIRTISEIDPITTDEWATEQAVLDRKELTTVAMDYGRRTIDSDTILHIYGTPGQFRFNFMWDILTEGVFGVIILVDSTDFESITDSIAIIKYFTNRRDIPYLLCVTKTDREDSLGFEAVRDYLNFPRLTAMPLVTIDQRDVTNALVTLITLAIDREIEPPTTTP